MNVHVRKLAGPLFDLALSPVDTVGALKAAITAEIGQVVEPHQLSFQGRWLNEDERLVVSYGVTEGSTLILIGP